MINESSFVGKQIRMQGVLETSNILSSCLSMLWLQYNPSLNRQNLEYFTTHLTHPLPAISIFTIDLGTMRRHPPQMHINKPSLQFWASRTSIKVFIAPNVEVWWNWIYAIHFIPLLYSNLHKLCIDKLIHSTHVVSMDMTIFCILTTKDLLDIN